MLLSLKTLIKLFKVMQVRSYRLELLRHRTAAAVEHSNVLAHLRRNCPRLVIDIGANRGQFALVARRQFPSAEIVAFEPLQEPALVFQRLFTSDPKVALQEIAIGSNDTNMAIHVSRADDSSSLLPIAALQGQLFPGTEEKEERKVAVRRLDTVLSREDMEQPALLKIDVQGFERHVLEGCSALLPCFTYVYVECSFVELYNGQALAHEIISYLSQFGFVLSGIYNLYYDKKGIAIQGDFLFENKNRPA